MMTDFFNVPVFLPGIYIGLIILALASLLKCAEPIDAHWDRLRR
jgi:hypothetical protein